MEFNDFKTNADLENGGVWVACGKGEILVVSTSSEHYKKVMQKLLKPHELEISLNMMDEEVSKRLMIQGVAEGLMLDWRGFTENGQPIDYSVETAVRLCTEAPRFRSFVQAQAENIDNFRAKKEAAEIKN